MITPIVISMSRNIACLILIDNFYVEIDLSSTTLTLLIACEVTPMSCIFSMIHANFIIQVCLMRFPHAKISMYRLMWTSHTYNM